MIYFIQLNDIIKLYCHLLYREILIDGSYLSEVLIQHWSELMMLHVTHVRFVLKCLLSSGLLDTPCFFVHRRDSLHLFFLGFRLNKTKRKKCFLQDKVTLASTENYVKYI